MKANDVIRIGRSRFCAAFNAASTTEAPFSLTSREVNVSS